MSEEECKECYHEQWQKNVLLTCCDSARSCDTHAALFIVACVFWILGGILTSVCSCGMCNCLCFKGEPQPKDQPAITMGQPVMASPITPSASV